MAHPLITGKEQSGRAQAILGGRTAHKAHRRPRPDALRGVLLRGLCDRRMTGNWNNVKMVSLNVIIAPTLPLLWD